MKKIGVVITDGVGFRNFVLSNFLQEAENAFDEVVVFSCLPAAVFTSLSQKVKVIELTVFQEHFYTWFFRKAKELAHLQLHKKGNFGITDNLKTNSTKSKTPRGYATRFLIGWTALFNTEKWIRFYNACQQFSFRNKAVTKEYIELLQKEQPDILFFTHQRPEFIAPLAYAAEKLKIKTAAFIFSWDNLASKGRMAADFDYYLVWSDLMQQELLQFYTKIPARNVEVVGTPQFEPYVMEQYKTTKEDFCHRFDLDRSKPIVCFSCGDSATSKNDELYISCIANAMVAKIIPDCNLIVRTSPAEDGSRFLAIKNQYSFIKWNFPKWKLSRENHQQIWSQRVPTVEDVKDLRALIEFSDLNINMLSTMSLDFMQFDKPVINTVFGNESNGLYDDQRFLKYAHIVHVVNSRATKIVKEEASLLKAIKDYLDHPDSDSEKRKAFQSMQIGKPLAGTSERIAEKLLAWTNR